MIIGHEAQLGQLRQAGKSGQLANSYLFSGPDGIGKKLVAIEFIKGLFCTAPSPAPCGTCIPCLKIEHNTHPDVIMVSVEEDKKDISIEQMRKVQSSIQMHPLEGRYKIVIIDNAEKMNASAANSMLKALEEPPAVTHFFLVTSRPHMLLPTILSRCHKISFSPPQAMSIVPYIQKTAGIDEKMAELLANVSGGSIGLALSLSTDLLNEALEAVQKIWNRTGPSELIAIAERWGKSDVDHGTILAFLISIYRDIALYQAVKKPPVFKMIAEKIAAMAETTPPRTT